MITNMTRAMSFQAIKSERSKRYIQILEIIGDKEMTAREIECKRQELEKEQGNNTRFDMNHVRPRITELIKFYHELKECGEVVDFETNRTVAVFRRTTDEEKKELDEIARKQLEKMFEENMDHIPRID